ncbi:hypothetical protein QBC34DRAFT_31664 [Podospora aff. communis PSN243]|uniref:Uncharacterized protein n=1 Tax=Podospora aff. communis PSN243 TaxID=3040156 RepID=A0AAV9GY26_9PEZI|nr:hypothetical protein QBC34DRAFT_31664 [Podospora aff. communis PSN243]
MLTAGSPHLSICMSPKPLPPTKNRKFHHKHHHLNLIKPAHILPYHLQHTHFPSTHLPHLALTTLISHNHHPNSHQPGFTLHSQALTHLVPARQTASFQLCPRKIITDSSYPRSPIHQICPFPFRLGQETRASKATRKSGHAMTRPGILPAPSAATLPLSLPSSAACDGKQAGKARRQGQGGRGRSGAWLRSVSAVQFGSVSTGERQTARQAGRRETKTVPQTEERSLTHSVQPSPGASNSPRPALRCFFGTCFRKRRVQGGRVESVWVTLSVAAFSHYFFPVFPKNGACLFAAREVPHRNGLPCST